MKRGILLIALPILIVGCSSGGDGSSENTASLPPAEITSDNAKIITGAVVGAVFEGGDLSSFAGLGGGAGLTLTDPEVQVLAKVGEKYAAQTQQLKSWAQSGTLQTDIPPQTSPCLVSGTVTLSGNLSGTTTLVAGDTITLSYSACDDGDGAGVVNGTFAMTIMLFSGDLASGMFDFKVSIALTGFAVTAEGVTTTASGDMTVDLDTTTSPSITTSISSNSLRLQSGGESQTLVDLEIAQSIDELTFAYTMDASGRLSSSAFEGQVSFSTTAVLQSDGTSYAYDGQLLINGANNASIQLVVLDGNLVRLNIDLDGNGEPDTIVDTSWNELAGLTPA